MTSASLDFRDRDRLFSRLEESVFDLVVIGGGVTGAGIARDAAMRGLSVALVEARDFASGTSSRSSKLIHGGLRYVAQGDLALVQEAASERATLERIAPHLARETPFVIPSKNLAVTAKLRAGLWTFEKLGSVPKARHHEVWSRKELEEREPAVDATHLSGAVVYPEFVTDDARLTLANVRSAAAHGASIASYAPVTELIVEDGRAVGLVVADALAGDGKAPRTRVRGRVVVNAAGQWVDALRRLEDRAAPARLALTKGVHLVVEREKLPIERTLVLPALDKRSIFAVPKGRFAYIGTTDTFHPASDYWPEIERADVDYLLDACAARLRTPRLTYDDLVSAWSGLRPLVAEEGKSPSEISRRDEVWTGPAGVLAIAGGKLTAYRRMAERVVDMAEAALGRKATPSRTAEEPLPGGEVEPARLAAELGARLDSPLAGERLVGLYGSEATAVADEGGGPEAEARHAVLQEGALTLEDWWSRRSARAWFDAEGGMAALEPAARAMGVLLGWSEAAQADQAAHCRDLHARSLSAVREPAPAASAAA